MKNKQAVIIGGSIAGLLTARVLSPYYEHVVVVDPRRGTSDKYHHPHMLSHRGHAIISRLCPGMYEELEQEHEIRYATSHDFRWFQMGQWKTRVQTGLGSRYMSRGLLEESIRRHVAQLPNVEVLQVKAAGITREGNRLQGVQVLSSPRRETRLLSADLVVDACGRMSPFAEWLHGAGFDEIPTEQVTCDIGYSTRIYHIPEDRMNTPIIYIHATPPEFKRSACVLPIENGNYFVTMMGCMGDFPPVTDEGYLEFAKSLEHPGIYETIRDLQPLSPCTGYRFPSNQRRFYEKAKRLPDNFIAIGDAVCSFNPVYAQGLTVVALEAELLEGLLARGSRPDQLAAPYFKGIRKITDISWFTSISEDFRYREAWGRRPAAVPLLNRFKEEIYRQSNEDPVICHALFRVLNFMDKPTALMQPSILGRVLRNRLRPRSG